RHGHRPHGDRRGRLALSRVLAGLLGPSVGGVGRVGLGDLDAAVRACRPRSADPRQGHGDGGRADTRRPIPRASAAPGGGVAVGDPLLVLNHDVRAAALNGDARGAIIRLALAIVLTAAFPLVVARWTRRWQAALLVAALVSQLALIGRQAHGGYLVKHSYGTP